LKVVVIGSGGREHALCYGISKSPQLTKLYAAPGNPGISSIAEILNINSKEDIIEFSIQNKIDLVVVGPEKPLVEGLSDHLRENGINVFGPGKAAAEIESSKSFAKKLMQQYNIPTADYKEFNSTELKEVKNYLNSARYPVVIKADGLAAGKGVFISESSDDAYGIIEDIFTKKVFGKAGEKIIIEEFLIGEEASIFAVTDGNNFFCLPSAQDYKRAQNGNKGKNTGGMGSYSPAPVVTPDVLKKVEHKIIRPVLNSMRKEGRIFSGCLYCGLMIENGEPKVVEFNCRFGDPETQAIIPLLEGDFLKLLYSSATGNLDKTAIKYSGKSSVCVVAASHGYPDYFDTGFQISGLDKINDPEVIVFHASTKSDHNRIITSGGRVLALTAIAGKDQLIDAKEKAYKYLSQIDYENIYYRTDISERVKN
jgi:phosphoribosylamine---glycine ligase